MYENLIYRRQFLLTRSVIALPSDWKLLQIDTLFLYAHPDVEVNLIDNQRKTLALIGSIFDPDKPEDGNADILKTIYGGANSIEDLFRSVKRYAGRYALFYKDADNAILLHDALALREIYYCTKDNQIICGSQPNLIASYAYPEIQPRNDYVFLEFYNARSKDSRWNPGYKWIGDETYYEGIKHLLPNHYLDINSRNIQRYWPKEPIKGVNFDEAVSRICTFLQGSVKAIANRNAVMMAVTAGTDSRTLLAASRKIKDRIYYFVNNQDLARNHPDIEVPLKIFKNIGLPFHVHEILNDMDEEFRHIFLNNTFFASDRILRTIYNIYFKNLSDRVNILGIGEIGRTRYGKEPKSLNSHALIYKLGYRKCRYAIIQGEKILNELKPVGRMYGINIMTLLYWEHTLGNWGATGNSESDIAIEELNPYDSHLLYELFLGVDDRYTKYKNPVIFREMIQRMWPELLQWPINPPFTVRDKFKNILVEIGLFDLFKQAKYKFSYFSWRLRH